CYPNPAHSGWIMFRLDDAHQTDDIHIRCINSSGQLVKDLNLHNALPGKDYHFYLNEAGVYVLSFIFRDGKTIQKKLVVMD
ncbi:MAG TPA: T9SS type A sorting domain-containing protein, partial [Bacteroidia bacterium]|nr:T9SS type A sorting domain-containing protein [Bacteroidia bacterium]